MSPASRVWMCSSVMASCVLGQPGTQLTPPGDTGAGLPPAVPADVTLGLGPEQRCESPEQRDLQPLSPPLAGGAWALQPFDPEARTLFEGGGITAVDVDGDDDLDIILPGVESTQLFLQQAPLIFEDVSETHLPDVSATRATSAMPGDVDGDGDLDLVIARYNQPDLLWHNDGQGHFEDRTAGSGLDAVEVHRSTAASFDDVDGDGDLDLFIGTFGAFYANPRTEGDPSYFFLNRGDGTFEDHSDALPDRVHQGYVFVGGWQDLDRDGDRDLYTVHDFGEVTPNVLAWNESGQFVPDDDVSGLDVSLQGMGLSWGDINEDGWIDLTMAGWGSNVVMAGTAEGRWFNVANAVGAQPDRARRQVIGWSTILADIDNDRDLDMVEGFGHVFNQTTAPEQPDALFLQREDGTFDDVGVAWGFAHTGQTRGVLAVDLDDDGWLDLVRRDLTGPATIQQATCGDSAWLHIRLRDTRTPNRFAIGAQIEVHDVGGTLVRTIQAGGESVLSAGPPEAHVGLGNTEHTVDVTVTWPDGQRSMLREIPTRRRITITRSQSP